jgi:HSP20 family protein
LMRFDPFREIDRMTEEASRRPSRMPMDAYRRGEVFVVNFDLPGVDPNTVDLTVEQNTLTVTAERTWFPAEGDELVIAERPHGTFSRQLLLGDSLDSDRITARYDQGVLTITIPVAEQSKARKVLVVHGGVPAPIEATSPSAQTESAEEKAIGLEVGG